MHPVPVHSLIALKWKTRYSVEAAYPRRLFRRYPPRTTPHAAVSAQRWYYPGKPQPGPPSRNFHNDKSSSTHKNKIRKGAPFRFPENNCSAIVLAMFNTSDQLPNAYHFAHGGGLIVEDVPVDRPRIEQPKAGSVKSAYLLQRPNQGPRCTIRRWRHTSTYGR